jgi:hypothetical protein
MHSNFKYFLIGAQHDTDPFTNPFRCALAVGSDFIDQYLQFKPIQLARHFDVYATNHSCLAGEATILL